MLIARDVMTTAVVTVLPNASIKTAAHVLQMNRISGVPVANHDREIVGVLTEYDLLEFVANGGVDGNVSQIMKTDVVTIAEDTGILAIVEILLRGRFRRLIVARGKEIVGVVSRRDIIFTQGTLRSLVDS